MKQLRSVLYVAIAIAGAASFLQVHNAKGQAPAPQAQGAPGIQGGPSGRSAPAPAGFKKRVLVIGAAKGFEHDSITDAMATVWKMGRESEMWEAYLRTDYELITKKNIGRNAKNLTQFDALVFANSTGEMALDDDQKQDLLSFVHEDGKGFVGIHAALDSNYEWPEYAEWIGGWSVQHPWMTFNAPI